MPAAAIPVLPAAASPAPAAGDVTNLDAALLDQLKAEQFPGLREVAG
ncbi:hypothetical protein [Streptomyces sp. I6]|nr:hypothetical protein [Streptomyces sp. I6]